TRPASVTRSCTLSLAYPTTGSIARPVLHRLARRRGLRHQGPADWWLSEIFYTSPKLSRAVCSGMPLISHAAENAQGYSKTKTLELFAQNNTQSFTGLYAPRLRATPSCNNRMDMCCRHVTAKNFQPDKPRTDRPAHFVSAGLQSHHTLSCRAAAMPCAQKPKHSSNMSRKTWPCCLTCICTTAYVSKEFAKL
ncbi:hypothetical protein, partial [Desulfovibrio sp.]|uniref:hypothetical protein n=1 Tax=Desulfovibrio sp. TaxID=885 RepID=UPI0025C3B535